MSGEDEVAGGFLVRGFDDVLTRPEQFDDGKRQIGKAERVGGFLSGQETFERLRIRLRWKLEIVLNRRKLLRRPVHDRYRTDAVFRAALNYPIAVGHVDQHIALGVEEAHDLKGLEHEAAVFVEDALAVLDLSNDLNRSDLATGDAGVTRILRHTHGAFHASGLGPGDVAGDTLDFGVVEAVDHDLIVGAEPAKIRTDRAGRPAFGAAEEPPSEKHDDQTDSCADNNNNPFHDDPHFLVNGCSNELFLRYGPFKRTPLLAHNFLDLADLFLNFPV
jgi:hypothetical protein